MSTPKALPSEVSPTLSPFAKLAAHLRDDLF